MRGFSLGRRFNLVIFPSQSIYHLLTLTDLEQCLACVKSHLRPEGKFIIELFNPSMDILNHKENEKSPFLEYAHPDGAGTVTVSYSSTHNKVNQVQRLTLYYSLPDSDESLTEHLSMQMYFP